MPNPPLPPDDNKIAKELYAIKVCAILITIFSFGGCVYSCDTATHTKSYEIKFIR